MRRRGFSFIELQTVIAIIAVLAAILFPVFARARERARQHSCHQNLVGIALAIRFYAADQGGPPPADDDLSPLYPRYLHTGQVFLCPSSNGPGVPMGPPASGEAGVEVWPPGEEAEGAATGSDAAEPLLMTSYYYRAGHEPEEVPPAIILSDQGPIHNRRANVVTSDGRVEALSAEAWLAAGFQPVQQVLGGPGGMGMPGGMGGGAPPGGPPGGAPMPGPPPSGGGAGGGGR